MKKIAIIAFVLGAFLSSCDSPLSDIDINDPSLINCTFLVERIIDNGSESEYSTAILMDKNLGLIHLKNGGVKVNNQELLYSSLTKIYNVNMQVETNTLYTFSVELSNGETYNSSVLSPANDFGAVQAPAQVTVSNDIYVTWTDFNESQNIQLVYQVKDQDNQWYKVFETSTTDDGIYTINKDNINYPNVFKTFIEGKLQLIRTVNGEINSNLRGGTIQSNFVYSKTINITTT